MAAPIVSATLTTKNDNSTKFSQPVGDSSNKCTLPMLHKGLENMKEDLNLTLTALVESEKTNGGTTADGATEDSQDVEEDEEDDVEDSNQNHPEIQEKRKSEEEQIGDKKPKVS